MAIYGRALTLLREVHITLKEDLADIDLASLAHASLTDDHTAATRWVRVLEAVAPTLVALGNEVKSAEDYVARRAKSTVMIMRVVTFLAAAVVVLVALSSWRMMTMGETIPIVMGIGTQVACLFAFFGVINTWITVMRERFDKMNAQSDSPVMHMLRRYKIVVCDKFIVQYSAAITTGINLETLLKRLENSGDDDNEEFVVARSACGDRGAFKSDDCRWPIDPCVPLDSMPSLDVTIKAYCANLLTDLGKHLDEIKKDVTRYDRPALWRLVTDGMGRLRRMCVASYDVDESVPSIDRSVMTRLLTDEVLPLLTLRAVDANDFSLTRSVRDTLRAEKPASSKAECWRACMDDRKCKIAMWDKPTNVCRTSASYTPVETFTLVNTSETDTPTDDVLLRRPEDGDGKDANPPVFVCGFATPEDKARLELMPPRQKGDNGVQDTAWCGKDEHCRVVMDNYGWKTRPEETLETLLGGGAVRGGTAACFRTDAEALFQKNLRTNAVKTLNDQSSLIVDALLGIVRKYRYQINLNDSRGFLDTHLSEYYGEDLYKNGGVSRAVSSILRELHNRVVSATSGARTKYVSAERLADKVRDMSSDTWHRLTLTLTELQYATKMHRDNFPAYHDFMTSRMATSASVYLFFILLIAFVIYCVVTWVNHRELGTPDVYTMVRRLAVAFSVMTMTVAIIETAAKKHAATRAHNVEAVDTNGDTLIQNVTRVNKSFAKLREAAEKDATTKGNNKAEVKRLATAALNDAQRTLDAYDRCNIINTSVAKMPFPTVECVVYAIIALVFVAVAVVAFRRIDPVGKIANVRKLLDTRARVRSGEIVNMKEVVRIIDCCNPPDYVWDMLVSFAIIVLVVITLWFLTTTRDSTDDYESAIQANPDCV